jgi:hypothetical protein
MTKRLINKAFVLCFDWLNIDFNSEVLKKHLPNLGVDVKFDPTASTCLVIFHNFDYNPSH